MKHLFFSFFCFFFTLNSLLLTPLFSTTANFLKIGVGARNIAMGETGATSADINSIYWNPAGLVNVDSKEFSFMHAVWFETINYEHIVFGLPTKYGKVAFSLNYLFMSEMDKYDNTGVLQQEKMTAYDLALTLSYAASLERYFKYPIGFGYNLKIISSKLEEEQATTAALDLGLRSKIKLGFISEKIKEEKIDVGFVIQNIGPGMRFVKETSSLPTNIKLGLSYSVAVKKERPLICNFDINFPIEGDVKLGFGLEYNIGLRDNLITFSPRLGYGAYNKGFEEGLYGFTVGFGVRYDKYSFDYAFVPYGELGLTHRVSLSMKF